MCDHQLLWFVLTSWAIKYWLVIPFFPPLFIHIGSDLLVFRCIASIYPLRLPEFIDVEANWKFQQRCQPSRWRGLAREWPARAGLWVQRWWSVNPGFMGHYSHLSLEKAWLSHSAVASAFTERWRNWGVEKDASRRLEAVLATSALINALAERLKICMIINTPKNPRDKGPLRENR